MVNLGVLLLNDEDEFLQVENYTIDEIKEMIFAGVIDDAKSIVAFFLSGIFIK